MTNVVLGDIVTLQDRGKYSAVLGGTWGIASVVGPLVGGLLTDKASWSVHTCPPSSLPPRAKLTFSCFAVRQALEFLVSRSLLSATVFKLTCVPFSTDCRINLPLGAIAVPMLFFCLHLNPHHTMNFPTFLRQFDFAGMYAHLSFSQNSRTANRSSSLHSLQLPPYRRRRCPSCRVLLRERQVLYVPRPVATVSLTSS